MGNKEVGLFLDLKDPRRWQEGRKGGEREEEKDKRGEVWVWIWDLERWKGRRIEGRNVGMSLLDMIRVRQSVALKGEQPVWVLYMWEVVLGLRRKGEGSGLVSQVRWSTGGVSRQGGGMGVELEGCQRL